MLGQAPMGEGGEYHPAFVSSLGMQVGPGRICLFVCLFSTDQHAASALEAPSPPRAAKHLTPTVLAQHLVHAGCCKRCCCGLRHMASPVHCLTGGGHLRPPGVRYCRSAHTSEAAAARGRTGRPHWSVGGQMPSMLRAAEPERQPTARGLHSTTDMQRCPGSSPAWR